MARAGAKPRAKKKPPAKAKKDKGQEETILAVRVTLRESEDTPVYYINYAELYSSQNEFGISVARVPTKPRPEDIEEAKKSGAIRVETMLQLVMPPTIIPGLINALKRQKESFERLYGEIKPQEQKDE